LQQIIDIEIWKATKNYNQMNEQLAYTIAENQSGKYLTQRIAQQTVESTDLEGKRDSRSSIRVDGQQAAG